MAEPAAPDHDAEIADARAEIDAIDTEILGLLGARVACNVRIAAAKAAQGVAMPLRPAREVQMLRRLVAAAPDGVDTGLILDVWRAMIAANVRRQQPVDVALGGAPDMLRHFDVARRHFGGSARLVRTADAREALVKALEQPFTVAVVPWPGAQGAAVWWPILAESRFHGLAIIAALPMAGGEEPEAALVAARATLEPAGEDRTFGLAFDPHWRAVAALAKADLQGRDVARVRETVLVELTGFIRADDGRIATAIRAGLEGFRVIGAYARL